MSIGGEVSGRLMNVVSELLGRRLERQDGVMNDKLRELLDQVNDKDGVDRIYDAAEAFARLRVKMPTRVVHIRWAREFWKRLNVLIREAEKEFDCEAWVEHKRSPEPTEE
jgi:hypothetical protein